MRLSLLLLALLALGCAPGLRTHARPPAATPAAKDLSIVDALEIPIRPGTSWMWSAALGLAWKQAEADLFKGPILLGDDSSLREKICQGSLNRDSIPSDWVELHSQRSDSGVALDCVLKASMPFELPYFANDEPLQFHPSGSEKGYPVASFGIRAKDDYAYFGLRKQVEILFRTEAKEEGPVPPLDEYGVDLCKTSKPWRLIVAAIHPPATLAAGIERGARLTRECPRQPSYQYEMGPNDVLLVPEQHLECRSQQGFSLKNPGWPNQLQVTQGFHWDLDRGGADLRAEAKVAVAPIPSFYVFDKPYLIYVETRDKHQPVFAMWVDNAECLQPFGR